jgi:hypothetical protein
MTLVRHRLSLTGETMFPACAPFFDAVKEPPGSLTHPPLRPEPETGS